MTTILRIQSGGNVQGSVTRQVGSLLMDRLRAQHPGARVIERDLVKNPIPHIDSSFVTTMFSDNDDALVLSNQMIDEIVASDILVIESPMYNFGVPSALKAWIDHVVRVRKTFRFTEEHGVEGMLGGKKVFLVVGSGGIYTEGPLKPLDFHETYLRALLGFIGITDLEAIRVEGLSMGPDEAMRRAKERVSAL